MAGRYRIARGLLLIGAVACGRTPEPEAPAPMAEPAVAPDTARPRYAVEPVPLTRGFAAAVERGTRTLDGRPGPRYWQQEVDYRISAELDPATARLQGEETITYHNRSPDTLGVMVFHLYQNLFSEGVPRTRAVPLTGGMTIERIAVGGRAAPAVGPGASPPARGAAYQMNGTLMYLRLPAPLLPGDSVQIDIGWRFTVPPEGAPRTGHIDHELYNIAQWYPQVAVYDDVEGWHAWPYLGNGEFYLEYGDFDVSLTVPEGWIVAATGELENAHEVLSEAQLERLDRVLDSDNVVSIVTDDDIGADAATSREQGGWLTWHFTAEDVRDFAWATSDAYVWDATRALLPDDDGGERVVPVHAFYRPNAETWRRAAEYTRHALEFFAERWGTYIYPQMTSVEGPIGGMEYPMLVFVRDFGDARTLYSVIAHEVAHEWWPMMVGSKEPSFAWQDEGLATYIEDLAVADYFPGTDAFAGNVQRYLTLAGTDAELPIMRHADLYGIYAVFATAAYSKPAVLLRALGGVIGEDAVHEALREYAERWRLRHPYPLDFFNTVESVAGRDLDWFWHPWWYETAVLDQAVVGVVATPSGDGEQVAITIEDQGEAPMPVELVVTLDAGGTRRAVVPVDVWLAGARRHTATLTVPGRVVRVEIDPDRTFPDVDRADNVWERAIPGGR